MSTNRSKTQKTVLLAVLSAATVVAAFIPLRTLGFEITLAMIPVAVGAAIVGPVGGLILGAVFGTVSFLQCFFYSPFGSVILQLNPLLALLTCLPTRALAGYLSGVFALAVAKRGKNKAALTLACLSAPVLNTLFFMTVLLLSFYRMPPFVQMAQALKTNNVLSFAVAFVGLNGAVEILFGILVAVPISAALQTAFKNMH